MATLHERLEAIRSSVKAVKGELGAKIGCDVVDARLSDLPAAVSTVARTAKWEKPADWPDIRKILAEHDPSSGYSHRMIILFDDRTPTGININGAQHYWLNDGQEASTYQYIDVEETIGGKFRWCIYATNAEYFTTNFSRIPNAGNWDNGARSTTQANPLWIASDSTEIPIGSNAWYWSANRTSIVCIEPVIRLVNGTNFASMISSGPSATSHMPDLEYCGGLVFDGSLQNGFAANSIFSGQSSLVTNAKFDGYDKAKTLTYAFSNSYSLKEIGFSVINSTVLTDVARMLQYCYVIKDSIEVLLAPNCTSMSSVFYGDCALLHAPKYIDSSSYASDASNVFTTCNSLVDIPQVIVPNLTSTSAISWSFTSSSEPSIKDSLARFDSSGRIVGGFASFPSIPSTFTDRYGRTHELVSAGKTSDATGAAGQRNLKISKYVQPLFSSEEWSATVAALADKGWTLLYE